MQFVLEHLQAASSPQDLDGCGVNLTASIEVGVTKNQDVLALSIRESLIIEENHTAPLRRSARLRAPAQRLELSGTGLQADEITKEEFSVEVRHALLGGSEDNTQPHQRP